MKDGHEHRVTIEEERHEEYRERRASEKNLIWTNEVGMGGCTEWWEDGFVGFGKQNRKMSERGEEMGNMMRLERHVEREGWLHARHRSLRDVDDNVRRRE